MQSLEWFSFIAGHLNFTSNVVNNLCCYRYCQCPCMKTHNPFYLCYNFHQIFNSKHPPTMDTTQFGFKGQGK